MLVHHCSSGGERARASEREREREREREAALHSEEVTV
jgi:hypothetical protein